LRLFVPRGDDDEQCVIAEVNLWGDPRKGRVGYRCHKAHPRTIYVPVYLYAPGNAVRRQYGVPLRFIDFTGRG
jgi:hypothetical protein